MESSTFLHNLSTFIRNNSIFGKDETLLCAVSGGLDSMVMAHSLQSLGFSLEIAHVNFELRGEDSFLDEILVQEWAQKNQLPFHLKRAGDALKKMPGSLQENARNFRYEWLEKLALERGIRHLVLGHHAGDQVETILLQFFRGGGIRALKGMSPSSGIRRRPLLGFSRENLKAYAEQTGQSWREDASNATNAYRRNQVRHHLVPLLEEIFPGFSSVLPRNAERLRLQSEALDLCFENLYRTFLKEDKKESSEFRLDAISAHLLGRYFLSELLERKGFTFSDALNFSNNPEKTESRILENGAGIKAEFRFPRLLLREEKKELIPEIRIEEPETAIFSLSEDISLKAELSDSASESDQHFNWSSPLENIRFPLIFRLWKAGDRIAPKGMGGKKKKLSDVLSEARLSPAEKETQYLLEDAEGRILWIPGIRESEPLKTAGKPGLFFRLRLEC